MLWICPNFATVRFDNCAGEEQTHPRAVGMARHIGRAVETVKNVRDVLLGYAWTVIGLLRAALWAGVMAWPGQGGRWRMAHGTARAALRLVGAAPRIVNAERLHGLRRPVVVVANHSSYLDVVLLAALLWAGAFGLYLLCFAGVLLRPSLARASPP